jgi:hypothetical protein
VQTLIVIQVAVVKSTDGNLQPFFVQEVGEPPFRRLRPD